MLLVVDIGNTNIVAALFDNDSLLCNWRMETRVNRTSDEYAVLLLNLLKTNKIDTSIKLDKGIISCVVPPLIRVWTSLFEQYFNIKPIITGPEINLGMPILYNTPKDVGADRIVNAVAAYEMYKQALIVIDFGTATTFDCISPKGEYVGGIISPGIKLSIDALFQKASKLPLVEFKKPEKVIGDFTVGSMQSGLFYGYVALVDGLVKRIKNEAGYQLKVIATGGLATLIESESETIEQVDELLTIKGLKILADRN